jgi:hypothetical protein
MDSNSWEIVESPSRDDKSEKQIDNKSLCKEEEHDESAKQPMTQRYGQNVKNYE